MKKQLRRISPGTHVRRVATQALWKGMNAISILALVFSTSFVGILTAPQTLHAGEITGVDLSGTKFNDLNGNGTWDAGEPGLPGWTIQLWGPCLFTALDYTDVTGGAPDGQLTVADASVFTNYFLTNDHHADVNGDGIVNTADQDCAADGYGDGVLTPGPSGLLQTMPTDANGFYSFTDLTSGTYWISELQQPGWTQTTTPEYYGPLNVDGETSISENDFGNFHSATISGAKYNDLDGNGSRVEEPGLPNWTIQLWARCNIDQADYTDVNGGAPDGQITLADAVKFTPLYQAHNMQADISTDGAVNALDYQCMNALVNLQPVVSGWVVIMQDITNGSGNYSFTGLMPANYHVSEVQQPETGWTKTQPVTDFYDVTVVSNSTVSNKDFGNIQIIERDPIPASLTVHKAFDSDGNGTFEGNDAEATNFTWGLDAETPTRVMGSTATEVSEGTHTVNESLATGYTFIGWYTGGDGTSNNCAETKLGNNDLPVNINTTGDEPTILTLCNVRNIGSISGTRFNDQNGDGIWDVGEPVISTGVTITLSSGPSTVTDVNGHYNFANIPTGTYSVTETVPVGWTATTTNPMTGVAVTAGNDTVVNFGNHSQILPPVPVGPTIGLTKSDTPADSVNAGGNVTYTLTWLVSDATVTNLVLMDPLPTGTTLVSASDGAVYNAVTNTVTWILGTKAPGTGNVTVTLKTPSPIANGTVLTNTASIDSDQTGPVSATQTTTLTSAPALSIEKSANVAVANPGNTITYTVKVTNNGTDAAKDVTLNDVLPQGFTTLDSGSDKIVIGLGTIAAGQSVSTTYQTVTATTLTDGSYTNTATASAANAASITARADVLMRAPAVLGAETAGPQPEVLGAETTLPATGTGVTDYMIALFGIIALAVGIRLTRQSIKE